MNPSIGLSIYKDLLTEDQYLHLKSQLGHQDIDLRTDFKDGKITNSIFDTIGFIVDNEIFKTIALGASGSATWEIIKGISIKIFRQVKENQRSDRLKESILIHTPASFTVQTRLAEYYSVHIELFEEISDEENGVGLELWKTTIENTLTLMESENPPNARLGDRVSFDPEKKNWQVIDLKTVYRKVAEASRNKVQNDDNGK